MTSEHQETPEVTAPTASLLERIAEKVRSLHDANKLGGTVVTWPVYASLLSDIQALVVQVRAEERERCVQVCEAWNDDECPAPSAMREVVRRIKEAK